MKTYYIVSSSYFDDGKIVSSIVDTIQTPQKPEQGFKSTSRCDIYTDYFESWKEAQAFVTENLTMEEGNYET